MARRRPGERCWAPSLKPGGSLQTPPRTPHISTWLKTPKERYDGRCKGRQDKENNNSRPLDPLTPQGCLHTAGPHPEVASGTKRGQQMVIAKCAHRTVNPRRGSAPRRCPGLQRNPTPKPQTLNPRRGRAPRRCPGGWCWAPAPGPCCGPAGCRGCRRKLRPGPT